MLAMFVKKCGIAADDFAQASGGQQAIDLYEEASAGEKGQEAGFDIIFMDLVRLQQRTYGKTFTKLTFRTEYAGSQWL